MFEDGARVRPSLPVGQLPAPAGAPLAILDGVRVVDLTTSVAGPYASMLLGDLGADVLKVEAAPLGDDSRQWGPPYLNGQSLWYLSVNRNKRSIALDLQSPPDRELLLQLIGASDILLINKPAAVAEELGLSYAILADRFPSLVYVSITGFGLTGRRAGQACYDLIAEGYSGVMDLTGDPDSAPQKIGAPAADMLAGQDAAMGALAAFIALQKSGCGTLVDVALVDSMIRFLTCRIVPYLGSGEAPTRSGGTDSVIAIYQAFETTDKPITLGLGNDAIWRRFCAAVDRPDLLKSPHYRSNGDRRTRRAELVKLIAAVLRTRPRDEWLAAFGEARVPAGPVNAVADVVADAALLERGLFYAMQTPSGTIPQVGLGIRIDGKVPGPGRPPPSVGADKAEILSEWLGRNDQLER